MLLLRLGRSACLFLAGEPFQAVNTERKGQRWAVAERVWVHSARCSRRSQHPWPPVIAVPGHRCSLSRGHLFARGRMLSKVQDLGSDAPCTPGPRLLKGGSLGKSLAALALSVNGVQHPPPKADESCWCDTWRAGACGLHSRCGRRFVPRSHRSCCERHLTGEMRG